MGPWYHYAAFISEFQFNPMGIYPEFISEFKHLCIAEFISEFQFEPMGIYPVFISEKPELVHAEFISEFQFELMGIYPEHDQYQKISVQNQTLCTAEKNDNIYVNFPALLEFYIRCWLAVQKCFTFILQKDFIQVKCQEISLKLKRNMFRKHDFLAYMKDINGAQVVMVNLTPVLCILVRYHILAFHITGLDAVLYLYFKCMAYMISIMNLLVCKFISCLKFNHSKLVKYLLVGECQIFLHWMNFLHILLQN